MIKTVNFDIENKSHLSLTNVLVHLNVLELKKNYNSKFQVRILQI